MRAPWMAPTETRHVTREQEMVAAHRAGAKQRLRHFKCGSARGRIDGRQGECAKGERAEERGVASSGPGIPRDTRSRDRRKRCPAI